MNKMGCVCVGGGGGGLGGAAGGEEKQTRHSYILIRCKLPCVIIKIEIIGHKTVGFCWIFVFLLLFLRIDIFIDTATLDSM